MMSKHSALDVGMNMTESGAMTVVLSLTLMFEDTVCVKLPFQYSDWTY